MKKEKNFGAWLLSGMLRLLGNLPLGFHHGCAKVLAWLLGKVLHYREDVVLINLTRSFPEKTYEELVPVKKRFYQHLAGVFAESVWFGACRGKRGRRRLVKSHIVEFSNPEELNRLFGASRQLMLMEAHTGNWELIGGIVNYSYTVPMTLKPSEVAITYMPLSSKAWDIAMARNRQAPVLDQGFEGYVPSAHIMRYALEHREEKRVYIFQADQYPYYDTGVVEVPFLNQPTKMMQGAAKLACKLDMSVGYLRFRYREDRGYEMHVVPLADHASQTTPEELVSRYSKLLEEDIREQPWNYLWSHKRWKIR